jgi:hypothetical protein
MGVVILKTRQGWEPENQNTKYICSAFVLRILYFCAKNDQNVYFFLIIRNIGFQDLEFNADSEGIFKTKCTKNDIVIPKNYISRKKNRSSPRK